MKTLFSVLLLFGILNTSNSLFAKNEKEKEFDISFVEDDTTLTMLSGMNNNYLFYIKSNVFNKKNNCTLTIIADDLKSDLLKKDYKIFFVPKKLGELSDVEPTTFVLVINKEAQLGGIKTLVLKFSITDSTGKIVDNSKSGFPEMTIHVTSDNRLNGYNYLAYVGTNFDLVDGIKAKNLFFAANMFLPPATSYRAFFSKNERKIYRELSKLKNSKDTLKKVELDTIRCFKRDAVRSIGIYLSLYGNRTFSATDSLKDVYRLSGIVLSDNDSVTQYYERTTLARKRISDNIGASFMPLFRAGEASDQNNNIKLYYGPSFEFIWRRIQMEYNYSNGVPLDTVYKSISESLLSSNYVAPSQLKTNYNEFDINIGGGLFIVHETDQVSLRIGFSSGLQMHYTPESLATMGTDPAETTYKTQYNCYFSGKAWITDRNSGLTLQAEVINTIVNSRPYYGVTLSKAINYQKLGELFAPLTNR